MNDPIDRRAAIDAMCSACWDWCDEGVCKRVSALQQLPPAQPDGWFERNKDKILEAGMEGREVEFRIGGRLFAIREKAQ